MTNLEHKIMCHIHEFRGTTYTSQQHVHQGQFCVNHVRRKVEK